MHILWKNAITCYRHSAVRYRIQDPKLGYSRRGSFSYWYNGHREEVSCQVFQLSCKLFYYPVFSVILQQSSLLQIDSIPVSWVYSWNRRSRRECMLRSWLKGRNLDLSSWNIYCLSQIFYGLQERFEWGVRLKTELRGCSLCRGRWRKGVNCLTAGLWLLMDIFYGRVRIPLLLFQLLQTQGVVCRGSLLTVPFLCWEQGNEGCVGFCSCRWASQGARA